MLKKLFMFLFVLMLCCTAFKVKASNGTTDTGHSGVIELGFKNPHLGYKILNQMPNSEINSAYKKVKKRAFGWSVHEINNAVPIWYISDVIFSKSNRTNQVFNFTYTTKYSTESALELSASGSIATKVSGKVKAITMSVNLDLEGEITKATKNYYEEKTTFTVVLNPGKKVSLLVRGDANVSTGVGKNYILGIPFNKGTWEYIDFVTEYYEFLEEDI